MSQYLSRSMIQVCFNCLGYSGITIRYVTWKFSPWYKYPHIIIQLNPSFILFYIWLFSSAENTIMAFLDHLPALAGLFIIQAISVHAVALLPWARFYLFYITVTLLTCWLRLIFYDYPPLVKPIQLSRKSLPIPTNYLNFAGNFSKRSIFVATFMAYNRSDIP